MPDPGKYRPAARRFEVIGSLNEAVRRSFVSAGAIVVADLTGCGIAVSISAVDYQDAIRIFASGSAFFVRQNGVAARIPAGRLAGGA